MDDKNWKNYLKTNNSNKSKKNKNIRVKKSKEEGEVVEGLSNTCLDKAYLEICILFMRRLWFYCRQVLSTGRGGKWCEQNSTGHGDSCTPGIVPAEIRPICSPPFSNSLALHEHLQNIT